MDLQNIKTEDLVFYIKKDDIQHEATEKLGRNLTDEEIEIAKKGLQMGILTGIDNVYSTIFFEML